jgi:peptide/nickel transport system ATP-binding protein
MDKLEINDLRINFNTREGVIRAVEGVNITLNRGEVVGLVGESGSGKSVTCNSILQLLPSPPAKIESGSIKWKNKDLLKEQKGDMEVIRGKEISMVFQDPMSSLNPYLPVLDQVAEPLIIHGMASLPEARKKAGEMLLKVGVSRVAENPRAYPHEFSGGMRQRAMIAMALITQPSVLLADEPTTALDVTVQSKILCILKELCRDLQISVLFVSHDLGLVAELADRVIVMYRGKIVENNNTKSLFSNPKHPYVKALIACRPTLDSKITRLPTIADFMDEENNKIQKDEKLDLNPIHLDSEETLVEIKGLFVDFPSESGLIRAIDGINLKIRKGTTHGIVGESGSGKTTLGRAILQLVQPTAGQFYLNGNVVVFKSIRERKRFCKSMQIIFQDPYASLNPRLTVEQILTEPMIVHGIGKSRKERMTRAMEIMEEVGLDAGFLNRYPHQFSGGQRQRICVARALTTEPEFIVCDECVSAMDVSVQAQVLNLLKSLQVSRGLTYLFISHDLSVVKFMSDQIAVMQKGRIIENGTADQIYNDPQSEYTRALIDAVPKANCSLSHTY